METVATTVLVTDTVGDLDFDKVASGDCDLERERVLVGYGDRERV